MDYSGYEALKVEKDGTLAILTINRPEVLNAINPPTHLELEDFFTKVTHDDEINAIVVTGAGKAFCAGGDIKDMNRRATAVGGDRRVPLRGGPWLIRTMMNVEQPMVAAVNGHAIGLGASIALFCDIVIASETARIGDGHVKVGLVAGDGGAVIYPLLCGINRAKEYLMTGNLMTAEEAYRIGMVNHVYPQDQVLPKSIEMAKSLANGATRAVRWTKAACNRSLWEQVNMVLEYGNAMEQLTFATEDHKEATTAFKEKRPPKFTGR